MNSLVLCSQMGHHSLRIIAAYVLVKRGGLAASLIRTKLSCYTSTLHSVSRRIPAGINLRWPSKSYTHHLHVILENKLHIPPSSDYKNSTDLTYKYLLRSYRYHSQIALKRFRILLRNNTRTMMDIIYTEPQKRYRCYLQITLKKLQTQPLGSLSKGVYIIFRWSLNNYTCHIQISFKSYRFELFH